MRACVCLCVHARVCMCIHACVCVHVCACMCVRAHVCVYVYMSAGICERHRYPEAGITGGYNLLNMDAGSQPRFSAGAICFFNQGAGLPVSSVFAFFRTGLRSCLSVSKEVF